VGAWDLEEKGEQGGKLVKIMTLSDFASSIYNVVQIIMGLISLVISHN